MRTLSIFAKISRRSRAPKMDGGRKIGAWTAQQHTVQVQFDEPGAFANVNTLAQLQTLQT